MFSNHLWHRCNEATIISIFRTTRNSIYLLSSGFLELAYTKVFALIAHKKIVRTYLSANPPASRSLSVCPSVHPSVRLSVRLSVCAPVRPTSLNERHSWRLRLELLLLSHCQHQEVCNMRQRGRRSSGIVGAIVPPSQSLTTAAWVCGIELLLLLQLAVYCLLLVAGWLVNNKCVARENARWEIKMQTLPDFFAGSTWGGSNNVPRFGMASFCFPPPGR